MPVRQVERTRSSIRISAVETVEYERMFRVEEEHWWYRSLRALLFRELKRHLPDRRGKKILDAGCGAGIILRELGGGGENPGIDISPHAIGFCKRRGLSALTRGDVGGLPFAGESFDAVICSSVLYHRWVADPGATLREFHRVLREGGLLLLNLPAHALLRSGRDRSVFTARRFTASETRNLLCAHGFAPNRVTHWGGLLFPLAWVVRKVQSSDRWKTFQEDALPQPWVNGALLRLMAVEAFLLRWISFPFGVSILAVASKAGATAYEPGEEHPRANPGAENSGGKVEV